MMGEIFAEAMETLNAEFQSEGIHATILLNNFSGHKWRQDRISNTEFIFVTAGLTVHLMFSQLMQGLSM